MGNCGEFGLSEGIGGGVSAWERTWAAVKDVDRANIGLASLDEGGQTQREEMEWLRTPIRCSLKV